MVLRWLFSGYGDKVILNLSWIEDFGSITDVLPSFEINISNVFSL